jgi:SNF2 family DNA or RNA helicase
MLFMARETFDKKQSKAQLKQLVGSAVYGRGFSYYKDNSVGRIRAKFSQGGKIKLSAFVMGSDEYETNLIFNFQANKLERFACSCPYDWGVCKHSVALGLKFLDLFERFKQEENLDENEIENFGNNLVQWLKVSMQNKTQSWEDEEYYAEEDEEIAEEYQLKRKPKIRDAEIVMPENSQAKTEILDLKTRLKSIGIDAESIPNFVLKELEKKVSSGNLQLGVSRQLPEKPKVVEKLGERFLRKYCLVLKAGYYPTLELHEKNKPNESYWAVKASDILHREKNQLTHEQEDFLLALKAVTSWYDPDEVVDWGKLLTLAKEAEISLFLDRKIPKNRLSFKESDQKIKASLFFKKRDYWQGTEEIEQLEVIFHLDSKIFSSRKVKIFLQGNTLVLLIDFQLEIITMAEPVMAIVARIMKKIQSSQNYGNVYASEANYELKVEETSLGDTEIISLNEIIKSAEQTFELENKLPAKFEIKQFKKIGPAVLVNYDSLDAQLQLRAMMDYGFTKIDVGQVVYKSMRGGRPSFRKRYFPGRENYHLEVVGDKINYAEIVPKAEIALFRKFAQTENLGFSKTVHCIKKGTKQIEKFQSENWENIKALGYPLEYVRDKFDFVAENFKVDYDVSFDKANDWFEFDVACYCGENKITLEDLQKYIKDKQQFLKLADGRILKITNHAELEKFVRMLESFYQREGQKFEGKLYHAPELEDVLSSSPYYSGKIAQSFKSFMTEAQSGKPVEKVAIPAKIKKPLRDYQKEGINWFYFLRKYRFGGILADDMGLGKTLQALSLIEMNKVKDKPSIVICPKTLLFNWEDEALKFFPNMKTLVISGAPTERQAQLAKIKKVDLVITSYPAVKRDQLEYDKLKFNYCFLDEAQYIKNHKTQNAKAVRKINADYRLALTGTPLENSVSEIWSLFEFLMPGFLGTQHSFAEKFERPIMKEADSKALEALRKKTACFILRRTKEKVLKELPAKIQQVSHCQLGSEQNILYQEILKNVKNDLAEVVAEKGFAKSQIHILAGLTKLRQVCNHPVLLLKDKNHKKYASAKLELFSQLVNEIVSAGKKVLVFSQFTQMLDILAKELEAQEIGYHYLSGKTNNRKELVQDFNHNEKIPVFLISLKAGGTGLNLTSADNVIIFDPWWNPSVENQAIDRAHRIGQKNSVNVYRLIVKGTIEEKIVALQNKKKSLFDNMIGESNDLFKKLTWSDVKELFQ